MNELPPETSPPGDQREVRCPVCDSGLLPGESVCRMCGAVVPPTPEQGRAEDSPAPPPSPTPQAPSVATPLPAIVDSKLRERQSRLNWLITAIVVSVTAIIGAIIVQNPVPVTLALVPTPTPIPPTITYTPTWTPVPQATALPTEPATVTPTPLPSATLRPPIVVTVASGDTLVALAFRYQVSIDSIALLNGILSDSPIIQAGQSLSIPWPTPTPPLAPVEVQVGSDRLIADPTGCERYEIQQNDTLLAVAARYDVPLAALLAANRLDEQSLIRPGDTVCIPAIIYAEFEVFATPGPSPTPGPTEPPPGPALLYPGTNAEIRPAEGPVLLQWIAVKDLELDEWYMVEVLDVGAVDGRARRGFTRQTSFAVPATWRPEIPEVRVMRWRVSIVKVTARRQDGGFIYTFGGSTSQEDTFLWEGAVPTPTPRPSATPTPGS